MLKNPIRLAGVAALLAATAGPAAHAADKPQHGGELTYMIPADSPPSHITAC
jgi:hypothetical protein